MSKHGTDERGWPLVPVEPQVIPEGYEAVRVGWARPGEVSIQATGQMQWSSEYHFDSPSLIIRPIPKPIHLPLAIVPEGWWVARDSHGAVHVFQSKPLYVGTCPNDEVYKLPPWIAAQLPAEWHELSWDQSAMQQTEGGDT